MIEVRTPIPVHEYFQVRDDLEEKFNEHAIPIWMSADTVIRTWAGLAYFEWFDGQDGIDVDQHVGWGEVEGDWQPQAMNAAVSHDFVDEDMKPFVVMIFHDDEVDYDDDGYSKSQKDLAMLFKLTFGGQ